MSNASRQNKIFYYLAFSGNRKYYSVFIEKKKNEITTRLR